MTTTQSTFAQAVALHKAGDMQQAERLYRAVLREQPRHADALHHLGILALQCENPQAAEQLIEKAIAIDSSQAIFHYNLGESRRAIGRFDAAEQAYRHSIHIKPDFVEAENSLGFSLLRQNRGQEAIEHFRRVLQRNPNHAIALSNLGDAYLQLEDYAQAGQAYETALQINPELAEVHANLGTVFHKMEDLPHAEQCLSRAIELSPNSSLVQYQYAAVCFQLQRYETAAAHCRSSLELRPHFVEAQYLLAQSLYQQNDIQQATLAYQRVLYIDPHHEDALVKLADLLLAEGDYDGAIECLEVLTQQRRDCVPALNNLGAAYKESGETEKSIGAFERAIELDPDCVEAYINLANIYFTMEKYDQAESLYRRAVRLEPDSFDAHFGLGNLLHRVKKTVEAEACMRQALELRPASAAANTNLGNLLLDKGELEEVILRYREAVEQNPESAEAHANLGAALQHVHRNEEAEQHCRQAVKLDPDSKAACINLSALLRKQGRTSEASEVCRHVIGLDGSVAEAHDNLGNLLQEQGRLPEAVESFRRALQADPNRRTAHSNLLFCMNHMPELSEDEIFQEHLRWEQQFAPASQVEVLWENRRQTNRLLRIGYVSADFRQHVCARYIEPLLRCHNREKFHITCYAEVGHPDEVTKRHQQYADQWRFLCGKSDEQAAREIRADKIDILVDLSGHTAGNRLGLFGLRSAPVQVTYLGYPNTTGLSSIDYRITDPWADPVEHDQWHTEKLVRLPTGFLCFRPEEDAPEVSVLPALENGFITFGSFNRLSKINDEVIALWSEVLNRVPRSRLLLKTPSLEDEATRQRYLERFAAHKIASERILLRSISATHREHLDMYSNVDIALDPFPYHGTGTTCDALWMGLPVVTLRSRMHAGNVGVSLLNAVGHREWIAQSSEDYIRAAVSLTRDLSGLATIRSGLRDEVRRSSLCDEQKHTEQIEQAYCRLWSNWCGEDRESAEKFQQVASLRQGKLQ